MAFEDALATWLVDQRWFAGKGRELGDLSVVSDTHVEHDESDRVLCVNNLSRFPQPVELDLRRFMGVTPVECMGGVTFPPIGELPYLLTLPGHGFYWFQLPLPREDLQ